MRKVAVATVAVTLVLTAVYVWLSGVAELAAYEVVVVVLGVVALIALGIPIPTEARRRSTGTIRLVPSQLHRVERVVWFARSAMVDADRRLYPLLRDQARELLLSRRGIALETEPELARSVLGEAAWDRVRPDRPVSEDRTAPGVELEDIEIVVDAIERAIGRLPA